ncbi:glycoside hydrolase family 88 protein [Sporolactobacillus shoreicorticis]|uniref:Glycoside hydrolase family 88 protein n=1 Tax=Sporolactobacillus shoreicorticis TaxID=1923877 RepID=A0ABW5S262_9BACL|nr:glycoside hydrolase family 88 protein [Sporolactobacillus shoreicorticis]MCO7124716.1 glycoside hydrolase family 88 protein [Sporolactobacillus shoreicorticis]
MIEQSTKEWSSNLLKKIEKKIEAECVRLGDGIPYIPENGRYEDIGAKDIIWWTNGFWGGILWQLYHATKKEIFRTTAEKVEARLDQAFDIYKGLHHDVGFMWQPTAIADYRLTGNERSMQRGLHAATLLAGRYNPRGKFIRSWNRDRAGWVIVDSMLNIQTLFWAKDTIKDPRFGYIAEDHADKVQKYIVREDGSVNHIAVFDPTNGELLETPGGQGYASGSSWSRGQSWAIYGFALSYLHTGNQKYLDTAKKVANYFIANVSTTDYIPLVDFRAPREPVKWDTTAGMCAACGMLEIAKHVSSYEKDLYEGAAIRLLKATEGKYANWTIEEDAIIGYGTGSYHDECWTHVPIIYGDYYFIEAVLRLQNLDFLLW